MDFLNMTLVLLGQKQEDNQKCHPLTPSHLPHYDLISAFVQLLVAAAPPTLLKRIPEAQMQVRPGGDCAGHD